MNTTQVSSGIAIASLLAILGSHLFPSPRPMVLSAEFEITPIPTIVPSSTPTPSPRPTLVPSPTLKITPTPAFSYTPGEIYEMYNQAAIRYSVSADVLRHIARCESGFNPSAKNYIYLGLYQFDSRTWSSYRNKMGLNPDPGLRTNPKEAINTAAYAISLGHGKIWPNCFPK
jgi:hypothetical protein